MKDYWDLSERERSDVEDLSPFYAVELMKEGLVEPAEPELVAVPSVDVQTLTTWHLRYKGDWGESDTSVGFPTKEDAIKALELGAVFVDRKYKLGRDVALATTSVVPRETAISEADAEKLAVQLAAHEEAKSLNEKRTSEWKAARDKCDNALKAIRDDFYQCRDKANQMAHVARTMGEYTKIAGDEDLARKFLRKAFSRSELKEAEEWFGRDFTSEIPPEAVAFPEDK